MHDVAGNFPIQAAAEPLVLKPAQAAALLTISERTLWTMTKKGDIPCISIGRSVRYSVRALEAWVRERSSLHGNRIERSEK